MKKTIILPIILLIAGNLFAGAIETQIDNLKYPQTRLHAMRELEKAGASAVPELLRVARNRDGAQETRIAAIVVLGNMKALEAIPELEALLKGDTDQYCREAAAFSLGKIGTPSIMPELKAAMNDSSGNVRMRAALGLARLGNNSGKGIALRALKEKDVTAQLLAIDVLVELDDQSVIPQLEQNIKENPRGWTRIHSMLALKRMESKNLLSEKRIRFLEETLKDSQFEVNDWAAKELEKEVVQNTAERAKAFKILKGTWKSDYAGSYSSGKALLRLLEKGSVSRDEIFN